VEAINLCNDGVSIKMKLELFLKQFNNFPHLREGVAAKDLDEGKYTSKVAEILKVS